MPVSADAGFDVYLPNHIESASQLSAQHGLLKRWGHVDLLGASWECQSVSQAGYQQGIHDPRFRFFFDMVKIINQLQASNHPLVYILENTYSRESISPSVQAAHDKVVSFLGAPILLDAADMESVAHRVRYYWQNCLDPVVLQAAMPKMMVPTPTLQSILLPHHYSKTPAIRTAECC